MHSITKTIRFEAAHILSNYNGRCGNLHGHSYICNVTFTSKALGLADDSNMIIDLNKVKDIANEIIDPMDHAFLYNMNTTDPYEREVIEMERRWCKRMVGFQTRTTAEEMSKYILEAINQSLLAKGLYPEVMCSKVQLYETATGCATYEVEEM